jgi:hypothetical protein
MRLPCWPTVFVLLMQPAIGGATTRLLTATSAALSQTSGSLQDSIASSGKELVVVSKTPEFFTYTLATISILLTVISVLLGISAGVGVTIVVKAMKEKEELLEIRKKTRSDAKLIRRQLKSDYDSMVEALKITSFNLTTLIKAKRDLANALAASPVSKKVVYSALQKTVAYPDVECLRLYSKALVKFENDLDIVRLIRNGLLHYARNPNCTVSIFSTDPTKYAGANPLQDMTENNCSV